MRQGVSTGQESAADFAAGRVAVRVEDARAAVRGLAREGQLRAGAIKFRAPFDQLRNVLRALFYQERYGFRAAQAVAGRDGVLLVKSNFVFVAEGHRDAALRIGGGGFAQVGFCQDQNGARGTEFDGGAKAGDA
jgi:hypothetical protein